MNEWEKQGLLNNNYAATIIVFSLFRDRTTSPVRCIRELREFETSTTADAQADRRGHVKEIELGRSEIE